MVSRLKQCCKYDSRMSRPDQVCPDCDYHKNDDYKGSLAESNDLSDSIAAYGVESDKVLIECAGATRYHPDSIEVSAGVRFADRDDPTKGLEIVSHPIYGPNHVAKRWVKKEDARLIRRCQSCQDYTIRMKRKEGPDLYIPPRHGARTTRLVRSARQNRATRTDNRIDNPASINGRTDRAASIFTDSVV